MVAFCKIQKYYFLAMHFFITPTIYRYEIIFHYYFLRLIRKYYFLINSPYFSHLYFSPYFTHPSCFWIHAIYVMFPLLTSVSQFVVVIKITCMCKTRLIHSLYSCWPILYLFHLKCNSHSHIQQSPSKRVW